jgi:hypothetical protein
VPQMHAVAGAAVSQSRSLPHASPATAPKQIQVVEQNTARCRAQQLMPTQSAGVTQAMPVSQAGRHSGSGHVPPQQRIAPPRGTDWIPQTPL